MNKILKSILISLIFINFAVLARAEIKIKFIVLNPSDSEQKSIPIKYLLPEDLKPEDVIDSSGLKVDYDVDQNCYALVGQTELGPKETKVFTLDVKDIWKVPKEKLDLLRQHLTDKMKGLEGNESFERGKALTDNMQRRIDEIEQSQDPSNSISKRVEAYKVNKFRVDAIENDLVVLDDMINAPPVAEKIITIKVEINNPYDKKYDFPMTYMLPPELRESDVVDSAGFKTSYDVENSRTLIKGDVTLESGEKRKYEIKVRDVWFIKQAELDSVMDESAKIASQLVDTEYEKLGNYLAGEISYIIKQIVESQKQELGLKNRNSW